MSADSGKLTGWRATNMRMMHDAPTHPVEAHERLAAAGRRGESRPLDRWGNPWRVGEPDITDAAEAVRRFAHAVEGFMSNGSYCRPVAHPDSHIGRIISASEIFAAKTWPAGARSISPATRMCFCAWRTEEMNAMDEISRRISLNAGKCWKNTKRQ